MNGKSNIVAAIILAIGLMGAAFLVSGRYYFIRQNETSIVVGDKWTGKTRRDAFLVQRQFEKDFGPERSE